MDAALQYWAYWNALALPHADVVVQIEDLTPQGFFDRLHLKPKWKLYPLDALNSSHYSVPDYTPHFIGPIHDLIEELGYGT